MIALDDVEAARGRIAGARAAHADDARREALQRTISGAPHLAEA